ncbi:MAG: NAD-dependent epimerase/dehydratase family protein [Thermoproteus sp. AZ2]|jgi:nucleoside-diphosphate-sugar epimerase|uniref:NAD-dependent epimerase/dehydratase family protein n=1 Tax=Thermoproteus sp. AZ2 TaxID=1609232 RepID=A0ACC6V4E9_9CREN|nr:MAG: UDP-glucose 4-epimerase [Thermoproteus sp. AZ2]
MKVLVTGGSGHIGKFVVERLVKAGHEVIALGRVKNPFKPAKGLTYLSLDITNAEAIDKALAEYRPDAVVHLAAALADDCERDPAYCLEVNVTALQRLLDSSIRRGVGRFVFMSSQGVYDPDAPEPVKEESAGRPILMYGITKYCGELIGLWYARRGLIDFRALRPSVVFGPARFRGPSAEYSSLIIERALKGEKVVIKNPNDRVNYIYVRDVAEATLKLLEAPSAPSRVYNAGGFAMTVLEFVNMVKKFFPNMEYVVEPGWTTRYPAAIDNGRIERELGWRPQYLYEKAVEDYIRTVKEGSDVFYL